MKVWHAVIVLFLTDVCAQPQFRAVRPDLSSPTQLVMSSDAVLIVLLRQLVCSLKMNLTDCCAFLTSQIDLIETDIEDHIGSIVDAFGDITAADQVIQNILFALSIIDTVNNEQVVSLIDIIASSGSSFDQIVSQIDADISIDQTIASSINMIDTQLDFVASALEQFLDQDCQSVHEIMISQIETISSGMDTALLLADQILQADITIASSVDKLNTQFDAIASAVDILAADACASSTDDIASRLAILQEQEALCCADLSSQIDTIRIDADTRLENIENILYEIGNFSLDGSRVSTLVSVLEFIENNGLELFVESSFDYISSQIESLQACASIPLFAPGTISVPGNYCLSQDITGDIIIAASNVSLDLNGFTITGGIAVNTELQHIKVIQGNITAASAQGILIGSGTSDIVISEVMISNCPVGVFVNGSASGLVENISLSKLRVENCSTYGYQLINCEGVCSHSIASQNAIGFFIAYQGQPIGSANIYFILQNAESISNTTYGFEISDDGGPNVRRVVIAQDCKALVNGSHGFLFEDAQIGVYRCTSSNNSGNGFYFSGIDSIGLIDASSAVANTLAGFMFAASIVSPANVDFTGNYAADNKLLDVSAKLPLNYGYSNTTISTQNSSPYWWAYWNSTTADKWTNANGSNPT